MNKKLLLPIAFLVLLGIDLMAVNAIKSSNEGLYFYGWLTLIGSAIIFAMVALDFLSGNKKS